ncbi:translation initiation factor IF-3 [Candidatus Parcubacteria bacterium]|nr:translation initiation factor IF-3 [Candidatus Parcubacteria bacterium]
MSNRVRINSQIQSPELRVIDDEGNNLGVITLSDALAKAKAENLDLIEISPNAKPPVAKIMDYGKFQYDEKKKLRLSKAKSHITEVKNVQVKLGTGEHDLSLKAKKASEWLKVGNRVKIDLYLVGRAKYMELGFLKGRIERILKLITENYKVADPIQKSPKGLTVTIEKA